MRELEITLSNGVFTYESKTELITMDHGLTYVVCHAIYGVIYIEKYKKRGQEPDVLNTNILELPIDDDIDWRDYAFNISTINGIDTDWLRIVVRDLFRFIDYINTYIKVLPRKY
ncbi:hypothetical protein R2200_002347 [Cronobacter malonaticus]|nr:hypothetical protein [Cronobacter malonaticus]ELQ6066757.1 hypothetical protein [Cronobacter malonaticus]